MKRNISSKRFVFGILCFFACILLFSVSFALEDGGEYLGVEWSFKDGVLSLKGDGMLTATNQPWEKYKKKTKEIIIGSSFPERDDWAVLDKYPVLNKVVICVDFFDGLFTATEKIKEVRYTSDNPVFVGHLFSNNRLEKIVFDNPDVDYVIDGNLLLNKNKTELYYYLGSKSENVVIPEGVEIIHSGAFSKSRIKSVQLPSTLKEIRYSAFSGCKFTKITIPESCERIGDNAFGGNTSLREVVFLGDSIDFYCDIKFYDGVIHRGGSTFSCCTALQEISLPSCDKVPDSFFSFCKKLKKVSFGENTKELGFRLFTDCVKLESVYIPDGTKIPYDFLSDGCSKKATILCHAGSKAETLAKRYKIQYKLID